MGTVMGGMLADPVRSYPTLFGPNSSFGGANGVQWLERYPYALPMLANSIFLSFAAFCVGIGLEEVGFIIPPTMSRANLCIRPWKLAKANLAWVFSPPGSSPAVSVPWFPLRHRCTRDCLLPIMTRKVLC